ncbi:hypothetical protein MSAN_01059300 [Mycena sanguinolenta]|uniref:PPPDE domain-containing protein n=1 Tax=Mycena sanguinolenta TaxID=230812 RepID=A0A8H6YSG6_9AGAR|nr:hypothetical protein MSAN_01059300 [Mycena sanguinolenta]
MPLLNVKAPSLPKIPPLPSLSSPQLPSTGSIASAVSDARAKVVRTMSTFTTGSNSDDEDADVAEAPALEPVYIVLRPLNLSEAPQAYLKRLARVVKAIEFEKYLILQHWGVLIGERYYHLHINDETQKISVSMVPFIHVDKHERHTIKVPIWRTRLTHDERVGVAVGIIKAMGNFESEADVEITDEEGNLVTSPADRERYRMQGRYISSPLAEHNLFRGKYNALSNNCIHFTRHYIFDQVLTRRKELKHFATNIQWAVGKWCEMGCKRGPVELTKFLSELLGIANPFSFTPEKGSRLLIKLLSIFLNIEYNPILDRKLVDEGKPADEALEEVSDEPVSDAVETEKGDQELPIPEILPGDDEETC